MEDIEGWYHISITLKSDTGNVIDCHCSQSLNIEPAIERICKEYCCPRRAIKKIEIKPLQKRQAKGYLKRYLQKLSDS